MTVTALVTALVAGVGSAPAHAAESPVVSLGLTPGQRISKTVVVRPVIADGADVTRILLYANGQPVASDVSAPWSLLWATAGIVDQDVRVDLGLLDSSGTWTRSEPVRVRVDNYAPLADFPWPSSTYANQLNSFTGVKEFNLTPRQDPETVARIDLLSDGHVIDSATMAPWTVTWDTGGSAGLVTLQSRTFDDLGNVTTNQVYAHVDNTPPTLAVGFDQVDGYVSRTGGILVDSQDPALVDRVELLVNGKLIRTDRSICCNGFGAVRLGWDATAVNGPATMTVRSYDSLGNVAEYTRSVMVDNDGPAITFGPAANAYVRGTFTAAVSSVKDATGLIYMSGYLGELAYTHRAPWSVRLDSRRVGDGRRTLRVDVMDKAGNVTTAGHTITIDNTPPSVKFVQAPKNGAKVTKKVKVTAAASDRFGIARVQLLVNGKVVASDTRVAYVFTMNPKSYGKKFTVQVRAYDKAGNAKYTPKRTYRR
ncbi:Ig-like domain-containing protein [Paractinoplanes toevensis]|uniref:Ig-like domain-containing protein n=1 Tax=Paractinoplanes toevensis TaxID=571911 RepID=UPI001BB33D4B|nr:Ig-like domain-containing protein [Actinoplanes toevensis]